MKLTLTLVLAVSALTYAGCGSTKPVQNCPEARPQIVQIPIAVQDSSWARLRDHITSIRPPTDSLNTLEADAPIEKVAETSLLESYGWRRIWKHVIELLEQW